jgi:penicillin amidase
MKKLALCLLMVVLVPWEAGAASEPRATVKQLAVGSETVTIVRDDYGVPRVFASSVHGLFVGNGYAVAEDRAWQMEKYRLTAEGRLAEAFGEKYLDHDKEVRRDGMTREELRGEFDHLPPATQEIFRAYIEGVNRYLDEARKNGTLSEEFAKAHWQPGHWTIEDSMAIAGMMARRFGASGVDHLRNLAVVEYLTKRLRSRAAALQVFNDLGWTEDPAAITTVPGQPSRMLPRTLRAGPEAALSASPGGLAPAQLLRIQAQANSTAVFAAARELGLPTRWGSYSWILAPAKSVSGYAMLVGGPQMGFTTPQIAHEIQLTGAGYNVMGMGFAGTPGVLIGANDHIAWTSTSGASHNEDVFEEKLKPGDEHQYFYRGAYRPMEHRVERILVRGKEALDYDVYRTVHGPVIAWSPQKDFAYAKQMAYFGKEYNTVAGFLGLDTVQRIQDIPPLAAIIASSHNILAATQGGDIGFWHCGYFPEYPAGVDPRFPLKGTGEEDWRGFVPFDKLPHVVNPPSGIIFNWNNKPAPGWKNYGVPAWGVAFHISNIRNALDLELKAHGGKLSLTDIEHIAPQIGRRNYIADWLKPGLLKAGARPGAKLNPEMSQALTYLRHWDNQLVDGSIGQTIFEAWYNRLLQDIFATALGDLGKKGLFNDFVNSSTVYHVLAGTRSSVPVSYNYLEKKSADEVRLQALEEVLPELQKKYGPDMTAWGTHTEWIKFDPLPAIPWYSRGTYIEAVVLAKPRVHGVYILPPGQSEDPHSPHYSDQLSLAGWWMFTPMELMPPPSSGGAAESGEK